MCAHVHTFRWHPSVQKDHGHWFLQHLLWLASPTHEWQYFEHVSQTYLIGWRASTAWFLAFLWSLIVSAFWRSDSLWDAAILFTCPIRHALHCFSIANMLYLDYSTMCFSFFPSEAERRTMMLEQLMVLSLLPRLRQCQTPSRGAMSAWWRWQIQDGIGSC